MEAGRSTDIVSSYSLYNYLEGHGDWVKRFIMGISITRVSIWVIGFLT